MRITPEQAHTILTTIGHCAGRDVRVILFGSRVDDTRKGGDIDLLIESATPPGLLVRAQIKAALENSLQIPVDIIAKPAHSNATAFQSIALLTGILLGAT